MRQLIIPATLIGCLLPPALAQQTKEQKAQERRQQAQRAVESSTPPKPLKPRADGLIPFNRKGTVLADRTKKRVLLTAKVCNRDALLEMFVCLPERKQHESILVLDADAIQVHTALLLIGARAGSPAKFVPKYIPPHGQEIDVFLNWKDKDEKPKRCRAQEWIQHSVRRYHVQKLETLPPGVKVPFDELRYDTRRQELLWFGPMTTQQHKNLYALSEDKAYREAVDAFRESGRVRKMDAKFLFAGSFFFEDEEFPRFYTAEGGQVICVANMPEALLDINVPSSDSNGALAFEARTDRIPPIGTEVMIELIPVVAEPSKLKKHDQAVKTSADTAQPSSKAAPPTNGNE